MLLAGLGFGEGPRWHGGRLWLSDFLRQQVLSVGADGTARVELSLQDSPSGLGWLPDGRLLVVAMHQRAVLRREAHGALVVHADLAAVASHHTNDMVVSSDGTAYVGNLGSDLAAGEPLRPTPLAIVRPDGSVTTTPELLHFPNGSVITPDGGTLLVGESLACRYRAFDIHADGSLGPGRIWAELGDRLPDGCTLDADGALWFAAPRTQEVVRVREGGEILAALPTPGPAYACMLGGDDGRTLFVLTSPRSPTPGLASRDGQLWSTRVDTPHAGRP